MRLDTVTKELVLCITTALRRDTKEFEWELFFRRWFRELGTPCFFLFKRNLSVTNAQYVELFSLVETYSYSSQGGLPIGQILFNTTEQLRTTITDTVNILLDVRPEDRKDQIREFSKTYREVFASTFAVDMFYNSCAIFAPPGVTVDIERICADAGYVHSAGHSIFIRNIRKARQSDLEASVSTFLTKIPPAQLPVPFVVYAHEDFSDFDKESKDQISRGIDGTKLYVEKMSLGSNRLAQVIHDMRTSFAGKLQIPEAGSYKLVHEFEKTQAIWLIGDRSVAPLNPLNAGGERYYICYRQLVKNENPFFFFDENKPAWKSHTTMPHSLTAALINSTRPHQPSTSICDPFGGTGTTWFETKRLGLPVTLRCSDLSPITPLLVQDNLEFFLASSVTLQRLRDDFRSVLHFTKGSISDSERQASLALGWPDQESSTRSAYVRAVAMLEGLKSTQPDEDQEFQFSPDTVDRISHTNQLTRFIFYIALRAELRYQGGYKRRATTFSQAFEKSLQEVIDQTELLLEVRDGLENLRLTKKGSYVAYDGKYSPNVVPALLLGDIDGLRQAVVHDVFTRDACDLTPNSLDVIVCDPPYGFNTTEDRSQLANLYSRFLDSALRALREHGHLIICLPAESYTGRDLPYCTYSHLVSNQVLVKAHILGKHVFLPGRRLPHRMLVPPYYWEAERALRRVILHFRVSAAEHRLE